MSKKKSNYPFNLVDNANEQIREYGYRIRILCDEDDGYYSVEILTVDENDHITDIYDFADNMFENELADCVDDAWGNVKIRVRNQKRDSLLHETIALLSADMFSDIYSPEDGLGYKETAAEIVSLAKRFEKELDWQGSDVETRDYILELEKFEDKIRTEKNL